jgi:hypothetical protein
MKTPPPSRRTWLVAGIRERKVVGQAHGEIGELELEMDADFDGKCPHFCPQRSPPRCAFDVETLA